MAMKCQFRLIRFARYLLAVTSCAANHYFANVTRCVIDDFSDETSANTRPIWSPNLSKTASYDNGCLVPITGKARHRWRKPV